MKNNGNLTPTEYISICVSINKGVDLKPMEYSCICVFIKNNGNLTPTDTVLNPFFLSRRVSSVSDSVCFIVFLFTMSIGKPSEYVHHFSPIHDVDRKTS